MKRTTVPFTPDLITQHSQPGERESGSASMFVSMCVCLCVWKHMHQHHQQYHQQQQQQHALSCRLSTRNGRNHERRKDFLLLIDQCDCYSSLWGCDKTKWVTSQQDSLCVTFWNRIQTSLCCLVHIFHTRLKTSSATCQPSPQTMCSWYEPYYLWG